MKFIFMSECETPPGMTHAARYWELVDEVLHAEKWGFDCFGVSEQHLAIGAATTSAPEVLFAYLFPRTSRIRFRHAITLLPKNINHPLKVAARTAVEDILSHGRIELATGRGNTTLALRAFEVDMNKSRGEWYEGMEVLVKAFTEDPFVHYGEHYKIPPRSLVPKPLQKPHPPLFGAATSLEAHQLCGKLGIGVLSWSSFLGWETLKQGFDAYRAETAKTRADGRYVNDTVGVLVQGYCAESDATAKDEAGDGNLQWLRLAIDGYPRLAKLAKDYAYMARIKEVQDRFSDFDYFVEGSGGAIFGSPETCVRQVERFRDLGANEVVIRIDSVPHDKILKSIELFGKYVIPHFRHPENVVRPAADVIREIRAMREKAKAQGLYVELEEQKTQKPASDGSRQSA